MTERADQLHHYNAPAYSTALVQAFFGQASHLPALLAPLEPRFGSLRLLAFPNAKIVVEREDICKCDGHTVHKPSQRRLTADWLAPRESDFSRMHSKVSSDWLPSYIKATWPVLEILKWLDTFRRALVPSVSHPLTPQFSSTSKQLAIYNISNPPSYIMEKQANSNADNFFGLHFSATTI